MAVEGRVLRRLRLEQLADRGGRGARIVGGQLPGLVELTPFQLVEVLGAAQALQTVDDLAAAHVVGQGLGGADSGRTVDLVDVDVGLPVGRA